MLEQVDWLTLVTTLPAREACSTALLALADEVRAGGGSAEVLHIAASGAQDDAFRRLFDRAADYGALIAAAGAAGDERSLRRIAREFETLAAIDYFPGEEQIQARQAVAQLAARLAPQEPQAGRQEVHRLAGADQANYRGRTWATRQRLWVDRMASAWLIRRFIDKRAEFLWLADPRDCPADALGFDFDGAAFTHVAAHDHAPERVTFEVLAASFGLDAEHAIARIGAIVHCLDVGGAPVAEAAGIEALLAGLRAAAKDDDKLLKEASRVFDGLYKNFSQESNDA